MTRYRRALERQHIFGAEIAILAKQHGAFGITNRPDELLDLVIQAMEERN